MEGCGDVATECVTPTACEPAVSPSPTATKWSGVASALPLFLGWNVSHQPFSAPDCHQKLQGDQLMDPLSLPADLLSCSALTQPQNDVKGSSPQLCLQNGTEA